MRLWIFLALLVCAFGASKAQAQDDDYVYQDYVDDYEWSNDAVDSSDNQDVVNDNSQEANAEDYNDPKKELEKEDASVIPDALAEVLDLVSNPLQDLFEADLEGSNNDETLANYDDYQFEDNRSEGKEPVVMLEDAIDEAEKESEDSNETEEEIKVDIPQALNENQELLDETRDILNEGDEKDNDFVPDDDKEDEDIFNNILDSPNNAEDKFEETVENVQKDELEELIEKLQNIQDQSDLSDKTSENFNDFISGEFSNLSDIQDTNVDDQKSNKNDPEKEKNDQVNKETPDESFWDDSSEDTVEKILEGNEDGVEVPNAINDVKDVKEDNSEDTLDKVYADLDDDLKQLFETWDKLSINDIKEDGDTVNEQNVLEYEAVNEKPFNEDVVLSQRQDYKTMDDILDGVFEEDDVFDDADSNKSVKDLDWSIDSFFNFDDSRETDTDNQGTGKEEAIAYNNDALVANEVDGKKDDTANTNTIEAPNPAEIKSENADDQLSEAQSSLAKAAKVEDLSSKLYDDLIKKFAEQHSDDMNPLSENFARSDAPNPITLNEDEPTIIRSHENYPNPPYPSNTITDWILEFDGTGIELNITDFAVNNILGDYLLIIPGGIDDASSDGLMFTATLTNPRRYRFTDVNRLFMRFRANPGMGMFRGFEVSVKGIPPIAPESEPEPEPEVILPVPSSWLTIYLAGIGIQGFQEVKDDFQQLVADMATLFINANDISLGVNTTYEITQVSNATLCNVDWTDFRNCAEVKFAVPLQHDEDQPPRLDEDDLLTMWYTYVDQDPFALRLARMGISSFAIPNDGHTLMVWLVIAAGVVVSMAMLAFALWRFSCFEDYTRMPSHSDTDSVNEKRGFDLYPTPHQPLPPLYADDYKWDDDGTFDDSTRVDMGGFTNTAYGRDELHDIDSDEDVASTQRARNYGTARDIY